MRIRTVVGLLAAGVALACGAGTPTQPGPVLTAPPPAVAEGIYSDLRALNSAPVLSLRTTPAAVPGDPYPVISGRAPLTVRFNLCRSSDPEQDLENPEQGDTLNWQFHFGDDGSEPFGPDGTFHPNAEHVCRTEHSYLERGSYTATLSVTDKHLEDQANGVGAAARTTLRLTIDVASADAGGSPPLPGNSPTPTPVPTPVPCGGDRCVFVSSGRFTANLGGLSGADAKCQSAATAAGLPGTYQAWLSDYSTGAATRFQTRSATPYRRVDGALVASNWADLTDGTLANAIDLDETGGPTSLGLVWTNTSASGTPLSTGPTGTCSNWTFGGAPSPGGGRRGAATATNSTWTDAVSEAVCFLQLNLYCFQQ